MGDKVIAQWEENGKICTEEYTVKQGSWLTEAWLDHTCCTVQKSELKHWEWCNIDLTGIF